MLEIRARAWIVVIRTRVSDHVSLGRGEGDGRTTPQKDRIELGNATLDRGRRTLWLDGEEIRLSTVEFAALALLAVEPGRPVTRDELSLCLYGHEWNGRDRGIDVCIGRLRRKLRERIGARLQLRSARGIGYYLIDLP
ncbi:MAG: winged helix-turn-helix domain-containing protein [Proteobacteria bacterium]|nr:winged helix-turn-helix domain-containing protein [Pseudomonadota bacterium]